MSDEDVDFEHFSAREYAAQVVGQYVRAGKKKDKKNPQPVD